MAIWAVVDGEDDGFKEMVDAVEEAKICDRRGERLPQVPGQPKAACPRVEWLSERKPREISPFIRKGSSVDSQGLGSRQDCIIRVASTVGTPKEVSERHRFRVLACRAA